MNSRHVVKRFVPALFLTGCVLIGGSYSWIAIRCYRALKLSRELNESALLRAIALEPRNASAYSALCRYRMNIALDPASAVPYCKRAAELNRYDASNWLDLAEAFYDTGQAKQQSQAIERAIEVDPKTPEVAWTAANFYVVQGELEPALSEFSIVLRNDPILVPQVLRICWRTLGNVGLILTALPADPVVYLQFVQLLASENQPGAARQVWSKMLELNRPFDYHDALFYVDQLLATREVKPAEQVWNQMADRSSAFGSYRRNGQNLVVNGSFENEILNAGFDWRILPVPGTAISLDLDESFHGGRSLGISYSLPVPDAGLLQLVPVNQSSEYTASAWMKSEDLQTAQGPRLTISDAYTGALLGKTDQTSGTNGWRQVAATFRTGPDTKLVVLRFARDRGDTVVRGRLWVDNVQLTAAESPNSGH